MFIVDRLQFHEVLKAITPNVYFQPPPSVAMQYPCIIYHVNTGLTHFAGNLPYRYSEKYDVTVVDRDPDTPIRFEVAKLPTCTLNRWYAVDNLNHYVYNLYI